MRRKLDVESGENMMDLTGSNKCEKFVLFEQSQHYIFEYQPYTSRIFRVSLSSSNIFFHLDTQITTMLCPIPSK